MVLGISMLITWQKSQNSTADLMILMTGDVAVFYMVIFQTCHAILWYLIPITHHCAVMVGLISTDFFHFKLLLRLVLLPLTRRRLQTPTPGLPAVVCCSPDERLFQFGLLRICSLFVSTLQDWDTWQLWNCFVASSHKNRAENNLETLKGNIHYSYFLITDVTS